MVEIMVEIQWERVGDLKKVLTLQGDKDYGLYQIAGHHTVFGDDSLLYIGKAKKQTFGIRIDQHESWLKDEGDVTIYVGRIETIDGESKMEYHGNRWNRIIDDVEVFMIYYHSPPYNSVNISEKPKPAQKLRIINCGDCGDLVSELSHVGFELHR